MRSVPDAWEILRHSANGDRRCCGADDGTPSTEVYDDGWACTEAADPLDHPRRTQQCGTIADDHRE